MRASLVANALSARTVLDVPSAQSHLQRARGATGPLRARKPRGFTLLEIAVVAALSATLFVIVVLWVLGFSGATTSAAESNQVQSNAAFVSRALQTDLTRAVPCNAASSPFITVTPTEIAFYADVVGATGSGGPDGLPDLVEWRFAGGTIDRAVVPGTGSCAGLLSAQAGATWETIADGLSPSSTQVFSVFTPGSDSPATPPASGSCTGASASSCLFDRVGVNAELNAPNGAAATVTLSVPISLAGSDLQPLG